MAALDVSFVSASICVPSNSIGSIRLSAFALKVRRTTSEILSRAGARKGLIRRVSDREVAEKSDMLLSVRDKSGTIDDCDRRGLYTVGGNYSFLEFVVVTV